jgi:hypothetical protein
VRFAVIGGRCAPSHRAYRVDLSATLLLHDRGDGVARIDGPEQVHLRHELQECRIKGTGLGVDGTIATSARIRDQDINPTPFLDDARHHYLDRSAVMDIDLNTDGGAARGLDLHDCAIAAHVLRLGLEFFIRAQIHIGDRDLGPQPGEPLRVGTSETPCCTRYDRNLSGDAIRRSLMPRSASDGQLSARTVPMDDRLCP